MSKRGKVSMPAIVPGEGAYRGWVVCCNDMIGLWWAEKDGYKMGHEASAAAVRDLIDMVAE
jgi:hypothetical protein